MSNYCPSAQKRASAVEITFCKFAYNGKIPIGDLPKASKAASRAVNHIWTPADCRWYAYQKRMADKREFEKLYNIEQGR